MIKETITRIKLTASDGMVLTNGKVFGKIIYLAEGDDGADFYEISDAEYEEILTKEAEQSTDLR